MPKILLKMLFDLLQNPHALLVICYSTRSYHEWKRSSISALLWSCSGFCSLRLQNPLQLHNNLRAAKRRAVMKTDPKPCSDMCDIFKEGQQHCGIAPHLGAPQWPGDTTILLCGY